MENGLSEILKQAMTEVNTLNESIGVTQRGGKKYTEVFVRVEAFRNAFGMLFGIETEIIKDDGKYVQVRCLIKDHRDKDLEGRIIGSGMAEEIRGSSNVNKTSALENCETSAIGRALASIALHGGQYASLNEVVQAKEKEKIIDAEPKPEPKPDTSHLPNIEDGPFKVYVEKLLQRYFDCKTHEAFVGLNNKHSERLTKIETEDPSLAKIISNFKNPLFTKLIKDQKEAPF